jgi:hypothetical protein
MYIRILPKTFTWGHVSVKKYYLHYKQGKCKSITITYIYMTIINVLAFPSQQWFEHYID